MSKIETKLEVVAIPVSDVDRAKRFYEGLGWRVDADFAKGDWRVAQLVRRLHRRARQQGKTPEEAAREGAHHMERARG